MYFTIFTFERLFSVFKLFQFTFHCYGLGISEVTSREPLFGVGKCQLMLIPVTLEYFSEKGPSQNVKFFKWRNEFYTFWDWTKKGRYTGHNVDQFDWTRTKYQYLDINFNEDLWPFASSILNQNGIKCKNNFPRTNIFNIGRQSVDLHHDSIHQWLGFCVNNFDDLLRTH